MMVTFHKVHNLQLEGPPQNTTGVSFTGLPYTYQGRFLREDIINIFRNPLSVKVRVPYNTHFYGFSKLGGQVVVLQAH